MLDEKCNAGDLLSIVLLLQASFELLVDAAMLNRGFKKLNGNSYYPVVPHPPVLNICPARQAHLYLGENLCLHLHLNRRRVPNQTRSLCHAKLLDDLLKRPMSNDGLDA